MTTTTSHEPRASDDVAIGTPVGPEIHRPTAVQLFRYCATTWNSHRIHFDSAYAATEGYPDVLVQSHLHGAFLTSLVTHWAGDDRHVRRLSYAVRRFACPGDVLRCEGEVTAITPTDGGVVATLTIREVREGDGVVCAQGDADVFLPNSTQDGAR